MLKVWLSFRKWLMHFLLGCSFTLVEPSYQVNFMHSLKNYCHANALQSPLTAVATYRVRLPNDYGTLSTKSKFSSSISFSPGKSKVFVYGFWRLWNIVHTNNPRGKRWKSIISKCLKADFKTHLVHDTASGAADVSVVSFSTYLCHMSTYPQDLKPMTEDSSVKAAQQWNDL